MEPGRDTAVLALDAVSLRRGGRTIVRDVSWRVERDQRWVLIGPNGCGKTTLARIASMWEHPSSGSVTLLGEQLGHTDVRRLRSRVAFVSAAMADLVRPQLTATEVVVCALNGALEPWWHTYSDTDFDRARTMLADQHIGALADRPFGRLSSGERQRVLLARALMAAPELVLLDEPNAGLDLAGREELVDRLDALGREPGAPPVVLVTHHVEEIPPSFTHLAAMRGGSVIASGPLDSTLDSELLRACFGVDVELVRHHHGDARRFAVRRR